MILLLDIYIYIIKRIETTISIIIIIIKRDYSAAGAVAIRDPGGMCVLLM
jgi:hypothetical protein